MRHDGGLSTAAAGSCVGVTASLLPRPSHPTPAPPPVSPPPSPPPPCVTPRSPSLRSVSIHSAAHPCMLKCDCLKLKNIAC
ncbi:hypothetical protein E2C01_069619 [Portunus trituberculatus]|uniref:Uncharacterized protein n=1 Tax=Portunus trituberculatus TaxID=210409 RepID=A0A5B7HZD9_PORTR|nr:hypothetical protein [Portunus trituberculatus]